MRIYSNNISSLFGNNEKASMYSEFANKKTGGYRKLLKQYYSDLKKEELSQKKPNKDTEKIKKELYSSVGVATDKTLTNMKKESDGLKTAADALNNDELWNQNNVDDIVSAVKSFVNEYNDVLGQASKVSSSSVSSNVNYMKNMTNAMSKPLAKSGITAGVDGKLSLDEDVLKAADMKDVKALFSGKTTYGSQISQNAANISKATVTNSGLYGRNGIYV